MLLILAAGCDGAGRGPTATPPDAKSEVWLIDEDSTEHDFGPVIGRTRRTLEHRYRLRNAARRDVTIREVVNRKPCCGVVRLGKAALRPGEETEVAVTLVVGDKFGPVVHETEVVTDPPAPREIVLRTTALAHPPLRVETVSSAVEPVLLGSGEARRAELRVFACGTPDEPPVDLGRLELRSTIRSEWAGPVEDAPAEDGLNVVSRRFATWLNQAGPPGEHKAEIQFRDGEQILYAHVVSWEVVSPLTASPEMIVISPRQRDCRILIRSQDRRAFRITRVECEVPGIRGRAAKSTAAPTQAVEVEGADRPASGRGVVAVFTDHPAQEKLELPFVVID